MLIGSPMAEPIELETLRDLVSSGVVHTVTVLAQADGFTVHARSGLAERILVSKAGQVSIFATADEAVGKLDSVGLTGVAIDSRHPDANVSAPRVEATDPNRVLTTQDEYDEWFRERVEEALRDEAEGTLQWHSHADVWAKVAKAAEAVVAEREARYALTKEGKSSRPKKDV
jgi:hypothetical protein